ncbi:MAG: porin [Bacteroidota bacterium]|nr:porin [Bacteroidota bacterium]
MKRTESITIDMADFGMKNLAGTRKVYGFDIAGQYNGFSFLFEMNQIDISPVDTLLLYGRNTTFFRAGGMIGQICYHSKKLKSAFLIRYDDFMPNDLRSSNYRMANLSFAYNYYFNNENTAFRVQYWYRLYKDNTMFDNKFREDQLRIGFQFAF